MSGRPIRINLTGQQSKRGRDSRRESEANAELLGFDTLKVRQEPHPPVFSLP